MTRRHDVLLKFARNIVGLSRAAAQAGEGQELSELHALAVVGGMHQMIYGQLLGDGPDSLLEIIDDMVQISVALLTVRIPPVRPAPVRRTKRRLEPVRPAPRLRRARR